MFNQAILERQGKLEFWVTHQENASRFKSFHELNTSLHICMSFIKVRKKRQSHKSKCLLIENADLLVYLYVVLHALAELEPIEVLGVLKQDLIYLTAIHPHSNQHLNSQKTKLNRYCSSQNVLKV